MVCKSLLDWALLTLPTSSLSLSPNKGAVPGLVLALPDPLGDQEESRPVSNELDFHPVCRWLSFIPGYVNPCMVSSMSG